MISIIIDIQFTIINNSNIIYTDFFFLITTELKLSKIYELEIKMYHVFLGKFFYIFHKMYYRKFHSLLEF